MRVFYELQVAFLVAACLKRVVVASFAVQHKRQSIFAKIRQIVPSSTYGAGQAKKFNRQVGSICISGRKVPVARGDTKKTYQILFLGNSITLHPPAGEWSGSWGMAASTSNNAYPEVVAQDISNRKNAVVNWRACNVSPTIETARIPYDRVLRDIVSSANDALVVQLGDNIIADKKSYTQFGERLSKLLAKHNECKIVTSTFWKSNDELQEIVVSSASGSRSNYIDLTSIMLNSENPDQYTANSEEKWSWGDMKTNGVGSHPGDRGMKQIASRISPTLLSCLR